MGLTVTKTGPYFNGSGQPVPNNQTEVKFSQLRDTFRLNNPTGSISASELLRDIDTNSSDPIVPDATENSNCLLYTSPSPRDRTRSRMPSSA